MDDITGCGIHNTQHTNTQTHQAEEALKQREAARGVEERWQQQLAREAADARLELKALGTAVGEDIGANVAVIRSVRRVGHMRMCMCMCMRSD